MRRKRVWASAGWLVLLVGLIGSPQPAHAAGVEQFSDTDSWPRWAVHSFKNSGGYNIVYGGDLAETVWWELMVGDPPNNGKIHRTRTFRPNDTITRAEYTTILTRALGLEVTPGQGADWFKPAVKVLAANGILTDQNDFNLPITRREMGDWVGRALSWYGVEIPSGEPPQFPDIDGLPEAPQIQLAARAGVIKGYPDGTFGPEKTATRTEGAAMAIRVAKQLTKNLPDPELFRTQYKELWTIITQSSKVMATGEVWFDYHLFEPYWTDMYLYGPGGYRSNVLPWNLWYSEGTGKYRELVDVKVTPIMLRETIALIQIDFRERHVSLEGREIESFDFSEYAYMIKRGTTWKVGRVMAWESYPSEYVPQAEGGRT